MRDSGDRNILGYLTSISNKSKGLTELYATDDVSNLTLIRYVEEGSTITSSNPLYVRADSLKLSNGSTRPYIVKWSIVLLIHNES